MNLRKNQANMTTAEKKAFVNAVLALKKKPSRLDPETPSRYDDYVQLHMDAMMAMDPANQTLGWAHLGPAFLPWHRYYIRQFELDLQAIDPSVTLPYWDWTVDNSPTSSIWSSDFMGGNGRPSDGRVMDGPFAFDGENKWEAKILEPAGMSNPTVIAETPDLKRRFGTYPNVSTLPTASQVADALAVVPYHVSPWRAFVDLSIRSLGGPVQPSFCNLLESWYGGEN
jgi:tyrosinase